MADERPSPSTLFLKTRATRGRANPTSLISIRLPEDLLKRLAEVGNDEGLAMSDTIRLVLERGLSSKKRSRQ